MIILRQVEYSEEDDNNKSSALKTGALVGGGTALVGSGGVMLNKMRKDSAARGSHKTSEDLIKRNFRDDQRDLVRQRRQNINQINNDLDFRKSRIDRDVNRHLKDVEGMANSKYNPLLSDKRTFKYKDERSHTRNGKTISAGYDNSIVIDSVNKGGKLNTTIKGQKEAKEAIENSRKGFIDVAKSEALSKNDKLKQIRDTGLSKNNDRLKKALQRNKKAARMGIAGAAAAGLTTGAIIASTGRKKKSE